ncbi:fam-l protein [Plasmodium malariae]|uniref:Fam-l protein n=1 Tax=Plasmodium malariae TaxID=5858 RepID=A0A1D3JHT9_PLAMA|nr:fam-l protein [Plasmodium malariae]SBT85802.1 fam-l protein [Plasmodium malariae]
MEKNIKSLFLNILAFIFLTWLFHFRIDKSTLNKFLKDNSNNDSKLDGKHYRLLATHKEESDLNILGLKQDMSNSGVKKKKYLSNNEGETPEKKNHLYKSSSKSIKDHRNAMKKEANIFETKKYSIIEKKIFKELDFEDFLKRNKMISNKIYKKIMYKKLALRITLPLLLFLLLLTVLITDFTWGLVDGKKGLWGALGLSKILNDWANCNDDWWLKTMLNWLKTNSSWFWKHNSIFGGGTHNGCTATAVKEGCILGQLFGIIIYVIPFIILAINYIRNYLLP